MSEERKFSGIWIPASLWLSTDLSMQEKILLVEINSLDVSERGCFKSNKALGEHMGLSPSRVAHLISDLKKKGLVRVQQIMKGKQCIERRIFMKVDLDGGIANTQEGIADPQGGIADLAQGYCGFSKESNTSKSNTERVLETLCDSPAVDPIEEEFDLLWSTYPKRAGGNPKAAALKNYRSLRKQFSAEEILSGVRRYAAFIRATGKEQTEYVKQAKTFLGPDLHWQEEYALPVAKGNNHENHQPGTSKLQRAHDEINAAAARAASRANAAGPVEAHGAAVRPQMDLPAPAYGRR